MDRFDLYDLCVTEPDGLTRFLKAAHGRTPKHLREDFAGTAALSRHWVRAIRGGKATAIDLDPVPLRRAARPGVRCVVADVRESSVRADITAATNFSIGYLHERAELVAYLARVRRNLQQSGIFVADVYGGTNAMQPGVYSRSLEGPDGARVEYEFEQREANPFTGRVVDALHFRVKPRGARKATVFKDAFVYHWRLWSVPELVDAAREAGFARCEVHDRMGIAVDPRGRLRVVESPEPEDENYVAYVVARRP